MALLNPVSTTTIKPQRPTQNFGEESFTPLAPESGSLAPIEAVISVRDHKIFVPRGSDLRAADRFSYQGHYWRVDGRPVGDQDHPFTGDDFGWMWFAIKEDDARVSGR